MTLILETERLRLQPVAASDVDLALEMFTSPAVMNFVGGPLSEDRIRRDMEDWTKRGGPDGCIGIWCISNRATGEKLGSICLLPIPAEGDDIDWNDVRPGVMPKGDIEVGYFFKESAWGMGYATEACRRLVNFAFEATSLPEVVATLDDDHETSKHVLTKCGFTCAGERRAYGQISPDWRISREDWEAETSKND